jgi:hypothetical protein
MKVLVELLCNVGETEVPLTAADVSSARPPV